VPSLQLVALIVRDYDPAIRFLVDVLGFELVEDTPALTNDGRPKRWVVVRPVGGQTGLLLARADGDEQASVVGQQFGGRVGLFLRVERQSSRPELVLETLDLDRLKQPGPEDPMNLNRGRQYEAGELVEGIVVEQHTGTP
jgi:catechol 2,3-dioxygenase-like lactoylglutathione lyase family enzyme